MTYIERALYELLKLALDKVQDLENTDLAAVLIIKIKDTMTLLENVAGKYD